MISDVSGIALILTIQYQTHRLVWSIRENNMYATYQKPIYYVHISAAAILCAIVVKVVSLRSTNFACIKCFRNIVSYQVLEAEMSVVIDITIIMCVH